MSTDEIFEPAFEVRALDKTKHGNLVRFAGKGNDDELALTGLAEEDNEQIRVLAVLNRKGDDGKQFPPMILAESAAATAATPLAIVYPSWRIEPAKMVANDAANQRAEGIILASESSGAWMAANNASDRMRSPPVAICVDNGTVMNSDAFRDWKEETDFVAVTEWRLWVPRFSDGERPAWEKIFEFPSDIGEASS